MSLDARLSRLTPVLSARERATLVLGSLKDGTHEDPKWRSTMPYDQYSQFNRLIDLMNGANIQLASYITFLEQMVDKIELRQCWLVALTLWDEQVDMVKRSLQLALKEPISQSEYQLKVEAFAAEWVPVAELAGVLAEDYDGWSDQDYENDEESNQTLLKDDAWDRVCAEKERELRRLIADGKLQGRGRGANLKVQQGAFDALSGKATTVVPDRLLSYDIYPDGDSQAATAAARALERVYDALEWRPMVLKDDPEQERVLDLLAGRVRQSLAAAFSDCWQAFRGVELVLEEVRNEFDGVDPIRTAKREAMERMSDRLLGLARELIYLDVEIEVNEPDEDLLSAIRRMVSKE